MEQAVVYQQQGVTRSLAAVARRRLLDRYRVAVGRFVKALLDWA